MEGRSVLVNVVKRGVRGRVRQVAARCGLCLQVALAFKASEAFKLSLKSKC